MANDGLWMQAPFPNQLNQSYLYCSTDRLGVRYMANRTGPLGFSYRSLVTYISWQSKEIIKLSPSMVQEGGLERLASELSSS